MGEGWLLVALEEAWRCVWRCVGIWGALQPPNRHRSRPRHVTRARRIRRGIDDSVVPTDPSPILRGLLRPELGLAHHAFEPWGASLRRATRAGGRVSVKLSRLAPAECLPVVVVVLMLVRLVLVLVVVVVLVLALVRARLHGYLHGRAGLPVGGDGNVSFDRNDWP